MICLKLRCFPKTNKRVWLTDLLQYKVLRKMTRMQIMYTIRLMKLLKQDYDFLSEQTDES